MFLSNPSKLVRSESNQKRCIVSRYRIDVDPQGHHAGQKFKGWFDMQHTTLDTPGPVTINRYALLHGDRAVLMPTQGPVRFWRLVEQYSSDGAAIVAQH